MDLVSLLGIVKGCKGCVIGVRLSCCIDTVKFGLFRAVFRAFYICMVYFPVRGFSGLFWGFLCALVAIAPKIFSFVINCISIACKKFNRFIQIFP